MKTINIDSPFNQLDSWRVWVGEYASFNPESRLASLVKSLGSHHALSKKEIEMNIPFPSMLLDAELSYVKKMGLSAAKKHLATCSAEEKLQPLRVKISCNGKFFSSFIFHLK